jgi:DNA-binding GntR family transcriptional regulator
MSSWLTLEARQPTSGQIADALLRAIIAGEFSPGQRLVERDLAEKLGTSRAPVREALKQLEHGGFVETAPYKGSWVTDTTTEEVKELHIPIRIRLEIFALKRVINSGTPVLAKLTEITGRMHHAAERRDAVELVARDLEFHRTLMEHAGFPHALNIWKTITPAITRMFIIGTRAHSFAEIVEGHAALLAAMASGDEAGAEALLRAHIEEMDLEPREAQ